MRLNVVSVPFLAVVALAGCQSAPRRATLPPAPVTASVPALESQEQTLRQRQQIEALIAQNDALHSRVRELELPQAETTPEPLPSPVAIVEPVTPPEAATTTEQPSPPSPSPEAVAPMGASEPAPHVLPPTEPAILPNAEGVIDLVALMIPVREGEEVNPFAVRSLPPEAIREVTLHVQGVIHSAAPCALINARAVLPGENAESLAVAGVEPDAVLIRHAGRLLRLPVAEKPVRIRLPL